MQKNVTQSSGGQPTPALLRAASLLGGAVPVVIVAVLLYAAFFIKPTVHTVGATPPTIERRDMFFGVVMPARNDIWAVGSNGKIVRSSDGGANWTRQTSGVTAHLQSIAAWDAEHAVAVGNNLTILLTSDGGKSWRKVAPPAGVEKSNKLMRVRVFSGGRVDAVGEFGTILISDDFGTSWHHSAAAQDVSWNDVALIDGNTSLVVGEFGRIQASSDMGSTWKQLPSPVQSSLNSVYFRDDRNGVAVGTEGVILTTNDGGADWQAVPKLTDQHIFDVTWDGSHWVLTGDKGLLLIGSADAKLWSDQSQLTDSGWHTQAAAFDGKYALVGRGINVVELSSKNIHTTEQTGD